MTPSNDRQRRDLAALEEQAVDLSDAAATARRDPPGWASATRRIQENEGNVDTALDELGIFPRASEVLRERLIDTLLAGAERRVNRRLGLIRWLLRRRTRAALRAELAGFAYGNAITLAIVAVEAERERASRRKTGHR